MTIQQLLEYILSLTDNAIIGLAKLPYVKSILENKTHGFRPVYIFELDIQRIPVKMLYCDTQAKVFRELDLDGVTLTQRISIFLKSKPKPKPIESQTDVFHENEILKLTRRVNKFWGSKKKGENNHPESISGDDLAAMLVAIIPDYSIAKMELLADKLTKLVMNSTIIGEVGYALTALAVAVRTKLDVLQNNNDVRPKNKDESDSQLKEYDDLAKEFITEDNEEKQETILLPNNDALAKIKDIVECQDEVARIYHAHLLCRKYKEHLTQEMLTFGEEKLRSKTAFFAYVEENTSFSRLHKRYYTVYLLHEILLASGLHRNVTAPKERIKAYLDERQLFSPNLQSCRDDEFDKFFKSVAVIFATIIGKKTELRKQLYTSHGKIFDDNVMRLLQDKSSEDESKHNTSIELDSLQPSSPSPSGSSKP